MTAAPYCSTRTLIIGQRPLTNQRIIEEGLRIFFSLSFSFISSKKNEASSFFEFEQDVSHFSMTRYVLLIDAIHFQDLFYDEGRCN